MEPAAHQVQSLDGTSIPYFCSGQGRPLLLVHGARGDHHAWDGMRPYENGNYTWPICDDDAGSVSAKTRRVGGQMGRIKASVELFETIRREYEFGVGTIQGTARKLGVHRRLVREALASAVPAKRRQPQQDRPAIAPLVAFIDAILLADKKAPRKQRHTAHRIYTRIQKERPDCPDAEGTIRRYVRERKAELGHPASAGAHLARLAGRGAPLARSAPRGRGRGRGVGVVAGTLPAE